MHVVVATIGFNMGPPRAAPEGEPGSTPADGQRPPGGDEPERANRHQPGG